MDYLTTHASLSPIRRRFMPCFVNYKKRCTRLAAASDKAYQLLAHGRWFSPGTPDSSSTTTTGRHDIVESGAKHQKSNQSDQIKWKITKDSSVVCLYSVNKEPLCILSIWLFRRKTYIIIYTFRKFDDDDKKTSEEILVMDVMRRNQVMISLDKSSEFPWLNNLNHI